MGYSTQNYYFIFLFNQITPCSRTCTSSKFVKSDPWDGMVEERLCSGGAALNSMPLQQQHMEIGEVAGCPTLGQQVSGSIPGRE